MIRVNNITSKNLHLFRLFPTGKPWIYLVAVHHRSLWLVQFQGEGGDLVHIEGNRVPALEGGTMVWSGNRALERVLALVFPSSLGYLSEQRNDRMRSSSLASEYGASPKTLQRENPRMHPIKEYHCELVLSMS